MSNPISIEALEVIDAIDRKGSFAAAANSLFKVPSALTYTVSKLEEQLGVVLFKREGRKSVLTPAGRVLLEEGREILAATERLVETAKQVDRGWESRVAIAVDTILEISPIYDLLKAFYCEVDQQVEVSLREEVLGGGWEAVIDGRVDLALGVPEPIPTTAGLSVLKLKEIEWLFAVAPSHPLASSTKPLKREDIECFRAVVVKDSSTHYAPMTKRVFAKKSVLTVPTIQHKIEAQVACLGVGFLPACRVKHWVNKGKLVVLNMETGSDSTPVYAVWKKNNRGKALKWFTDQLKLSS